MTTQHRAMRDYASATTNSDLPADHGRTAAPRTGLRALAARRPLALFHALAFGLAYPLMALVILAQRGVIPGAAVPGWFGMDLERAASVLLVLLGLLPATLLVTALEGGRPAVRALLRRVVRWRFGLGWGLVAVVALPTTTVALALLLGDTLRTPSAGVLVREVATLALALLLINIWEETAWAGFVQPRLERRRNFFLAALLTAVPFAAIHLPLQVINGNDTPAGLAAAFALLLVISTVFRALIGGVLRGSGDSLLAAALAHTFFNRSNNVDGIAADLLTGPNRPLAALLATFLLTVAIGLWLRRRLGQTYRRELDDRNAEAAAARDERAGTPR